MSQDKITVNVKNEKETHLDILPVCRCENDEGQAISMLIELGFSPVGGSAHTTPKHATSSPASQASSSTASAAATPKRSISDSEKRRSEHLDKDLSDVEWCNQGQTTVLSLRQNCQPFHFEQNLFHSTASFSAILLVQEIIHFN